MDTKSPFRFSLRTLLLAVVAVSVGTAAMVSASEWWQAITATVAIVLLIASILLVAYRSGSSRAYWSGFAVSSGMYLFLMYLGSVQMVPGMLVNLLADVMHKQGAPGYSSPNTYYAPTLPATPAPAFNMPQAVAQPVPLVPTPGTVENSTPEPTEEGKPEGNCQPMTPSEDEFIPVDSPPLLQPPSTVVYTSSSSASPYLQAQGDDINARRQRCIAIGHFLSSILFGMAGGSFAVWLHATRAGSLKDACDSTRLEKVNA